LEKTVSKFNKNKTEIKKRKTIMALRLGDEAPDFTANTTEGEINFHEWMDNSWAVL
jgi:hypothetical protein